MTVISAIIPNMINFLKCFLIKFFKAINLKLRFCPKNNKKTEGITSVSLFPELDRVTIHKSQSANRPGRLRM